MDQSAVINALLWLTFMSRNLSRKNLFVVPMSFVGNGAGYPVVRLNKALGSLIYIHLR